MRECPCSQENMPVFRGLRGCDLCNQFSDVSGKMERESQCGYDRGEGYKLYFSCSSFLSLKLFQNKKESNAVLLSPLRKKNIPVFSMANFSSGKQSASQVFFK